VDLVAVSGFNVNQFSDSFDYTYALGGLAGYLYPGFPGSPLLTQNKADKFTQEIRLSSSLGQRVDWLLGGFYTHEGSTYYQQLLAVNPTTGAVAAANPLQLSFPTTFEEYAAFADLTYHFTDRFDVQFGGRESQIRQTANETEVGDYVFAFAPGHTSPFVQPESDVNSSAFTYLLTPRFKVSSDLMLYARLASGYSAGGPNLSPGGVTPADYGPSKTQNYEIGTKTEVLDHKIAVDASLYYISWKDIQLDAINPQSQLAYYFNGSKAKSQGIELSVESKPITGLVLATWFVWNDAKLTEALPASTGLSGMSGDRIPQSSRYSGYVSAEQSFPLGNSVSGFVGAAASYIGERLGAFESTSAPQRQSLAGYLKADLSAGIRYDSWTANLFVSNVADKRGEVSGGLGYVPPFAFQYIQPRTVGLSVRREF
jgi:outer membrane receptor protein involved in Fe transport